MASQAVSVRVSDEVLEALQKRADLEKKKVSDVVRELIIDGLKGGAGQQRELLEALTKKTDEIHKLTAKAVKAGAGARYFAKLSALYGQDVSDYFTRGELSDPESKKKLMEQCEKKANELEDEYLKKPIEKL